MDRESQQRTTASRNAVGPASISGLAASVEAELANDLERIHAASAELFQSMQRLDGGPLSGTLSNSGPAQQRTRTAGAPPQGAELAGSFRGPVGSTAARIPGVHEALDAVGLYTGNRDDADRSAAGSPGVPAGNSLGTRHDRPTAGGPDRFSDVEGRYPGLTRPITDMAQMTTPQDTAPDLAGPDPAAAFDQSGAPEDPRDRLSSEMQQAREELSALRAKSSDSGNGSADAQRLKLDQRAVELRERVVRAQQALDERARKLRQSLFEERERLKAYHAQLQKKARQLSEQAKHSQLTLDGDLARQRDELEARQAELDRRRIKLDALEAEIREKARQALARKRAELEQAVKARIAELQREVEARQAQIDEKERGVAEREANVDQIIQKQTNDARHQMSQWQLQVEERERAVTLREQQASQIVAHRLEQIKLEAAAFESKLTAREQALAEKEVNIQGGMDARLAAFEKEQSERQTDYDNKLRSLYEREGQLNRASETREEELRRTWEVKEIELAARAKSIADQEELLREREALRQAEIQKDSTNRTAELDSKLKAVSEREATLQEAVSARLAEVRRQGAEQQAQLEAREKALREKEAELQQVVSTRLNDMRVSTETKTRELEARESAVARREADLETAVRERNSKLEREFAERKAHLAERERVVCEAEGELQGRREAYEKTRDAREAEFRAKSHELAEMARLYGNKTTAEAQFAARKAETELRMAEVQRRTEDIENRERRLREWQTRLENTEPTLESARLELQRRQLAAEQTENENQQLSQKLVTREQAVQRDQEELSRRESQLRSRLDEISGTEATLRAQTESLERLKRDVESEAQRLSLEREKLAGLEQRMREVDQLDGETNKKASELARREEAVRKAETEAQAISAECERVRSEAHALKEKIESQRAELATQALALKEQLAQARTQEQELSRNRSDVERDRARLAEAQSAHAQRVEQGEKRIDDISRQQTELADARGQLNVARTELNAEKTALQQERQRLSSDRAALERSRAEVDGKAEAVTRQREEMESRRSSLETEWAQLERDRIAVRDRERTLAEQKNRLESSQSDVEQLRRELAARTEETDEMRRILSEKAERMRDRKARLADDATLVDGRLKQLNAEIESLRQERAQLTDERKGVEQERTAVAAERDALNKQRDELKLEQKNIDFGKIAFEEEQRKLADREARLTERANQLEAFGVRLKQEYADVQKQRTEMAEIEAQGEGRAKLERLLKQAEARDIQVREREQALTMQERALSAVAAEVSGAEEELKRRTNVFESRSRQLDQEIAALQTQRKEFEEFADNQRSEIAQVKRQTEFEAAHESERLRDRERELEMAFSRQRQALESAGEAREQITLTELRRRAEIGMEDRVADITRREQQVESRCAQRVAEVERDIEQRLAQMTEEIKSQRLRAEHELSLRREEFAAEMRKRRATLQRELAETPSFQPAERSGAASGDLVGPAGVPEPGYAHTAAATAEAESEVRHAADDRVWLDDSTTELEEASRPSVGEDAVEGVSATKATQAGAAVATAMPGIGLRFARTTGLLLSAILVGGGAATAYLWSPKNAVEVRGRLAVIPGDSPQLTARERAEAIFQPDILNEASKRSGVDFSALHRQRRVSATATSSGQAVELVAKPIDGNRAAAQTWLATLAAVYQESLSRTSGAAESAAEDVTGLQAARQTQADQLLELKRAIEQMEAELASKSPIEDIRGARQRKDDLKAELTRAVAMASQAQSALAEAESAPDASGPVVPSEAQLKEAYESDAELSAAIEHQKDKAKQFHAALASAMAQMSAPYESLMATIETWLADAQKQVTEQTDAAIKSELQLLVGDVTNYLQQVRAFEQTWNELKPKVDSWHSEGDADVLLEYQKEAERLIREFHAKSTNTFADAWKKSDDIGRAGTEQTQRRVLQSAMTRLAHDSLAARNAWTLAARNVVPRYNVEMKALMGAIADLEPRIKEHKAAHRDRLASELAKSGAEERENNLERLRAARDESNRKHQRLSDEYVKADAASSVDETTFATLTRQRGELATLQQRAGAVEAAVARLDEQIERATASSPKSPTTTVQFESVPTETTWAFDFGKARQAAILGVVVAFIFVMCVSILARSRRSAGPLAAAT